MENIIQALSNFVQTSMVIDANLYTVALALNDPDGLNYQFDPPLPGGSQDSQGRRMMQARSPVLTIKMDRAFTRNVGDDEQLLSQLCQNVYDCKRRIEKLEIRRHQSGEPLTGAIELTLNPAYMKSLFNRDNGDRALKMEEITNDAEALELGLAIQKAVCAKIGPTCQDPSVVGIAGMYRSKQA